MPNRMPRTLTALGLAAMLIALGMLAGCGDDEGGGESTTGVATSSTTSEAGSTGTGSGHATGPDGGGSAPEGPSDTEQIEAAIEAFLVSPDSSEVCEQLVTTNLLRNAYGDLRGCLDGRGAPTLASSVAIGELEISAEQAAATAVPKGGVYAGSDVDFTVVLEGESWRIDSVRADIPVGP